MSSNDPLHSLFEDYTTIEKIKRRLPHLFFLAELDASRAGKIGMEIGSVRERIIVALLIYKFGEQNIKVNIPITEAEVDVIVYERPVSIKTVSGSRIGGVKAVWTVDWEKVKEFVKDYKPKCDILLIQINYGGQGLFSLISLKVQEEIIKNIGLDEYFKIPKQGTNPRGVEFSKKAMENMIHHGDTRKFMIDWVRPLDKYDQYKRWLDYWTEEN